MAIKVPKSVKVCGRTYKVIADKKDNTDSGRYGDIINSTQTISIYNGICQEKAEQTLTHEIFHAIENAVGVDLKEEHVVAMSEILYQVLMDNPPWWGKSRNS